MAEFDSDKAARDHDWSVAGSAPHDPNAIIGGTDVDDVEVFVPEGKTAEVAKALNDAAEEAGLNAAVVRYTDGSFTVPRAVADGADLPDDAQLVAVPPPDVNAAVTPGHDLDGNPVPEPDALGAEASTETDGADGDDLEKLTVAELRAKADKDKVDLTGANHKADIIAKLRGK